VSLTDPPGPPGISAPPGEILRMAAGTLRAEPARVLIPALFVFGLDAWADTGFTELSADHLGLESVGSFVLLMVSTLGLTFYSGLLERLVGAVEQGLPAPPVRQVLRTMPYGRLLIADAILWALDAVASLAFVVPGIIVTTLGVLVGPLISTQGSTVGDAFRVSVKLVAPHFLLVLGLVTFPLAVEHEVVTAVALLVPHERVVLVWLSHLGMGLTFGVALGLVEVSLAERLLHGARGPRKQIRSADAATAEKAEGGRHGRDDSRDGHAGAGTVPPTG
jgi:hypothetical protein